MIGMVLCRLVAPLQFAVVDETPGIMTPYFSSVHIADNISGKIMYTVYIYSCNIVCLLSQKTDVLSLEEVAQSPNFVEYYSFLEGGKEHNTLYLTEQNWVSFETVLRTDDYIIQPCSRIT